MRSRYLLATFAAMWCIGQSAQGQEAPAAAKPSGGGEQQLEAAATLTYGAYGPPRPAKVVVGDQFQATQTISGLAHDDRGMVDFSIRMEVLDKDGVAVKSVPWRRTNILHLPSIYHHNVFGVIPRDLDAGKAGRFLLKIEVEDHLAGVKRASETPFEVVSPSGVSVTNVRGGHDPKGEGCAGTVFAETEVIYIHATLSHFGVVDGRSDLRSTVSILNANGTPTDWPQVVVQLSPEFSRYESDPRIGTYYQLNALHRGKFIAKLRVEDLTGGTSTTEYLPLLVTETPDWTLDATQIAKLKDQAEGKKKSR
jgi:hypothetical protein